MRLECRFQMPPVPRAVIEDNEATKNRLAQLEGHVAGIFDKLDQMSTALVKMNERAERRTDGSSRPEQRSPPSPLTIETSIGRPSASPVDRRPPSIASSSYRQDYAPSVAPQKRPSPWSASDNVHNPYMDTRPSPQASLRSVTLASVPQARSITPALSDDDPLEVSLARERDPMLAAEGDHSLAYTANDRLAKRRRTADSPRSLQAAGTPAGNDPLRGAADPVTLGLISEEEGRRLFDSFLKSAYPFTPVLDPARDSWESMRERSPYCITVMLLIALKQREAAGAASDLSTKLADEVERITKLTLYAPVTLETLQAMAILISYSDNAWRICSHAMALAIDMRLYRCLPYLHKIRTEAQNPNLMLERQRSLVVGARIWLSLVRQAYEMSFNHALPILFPSDHGRRTSFKRDLLDHPLSNLYDSRLVISVEMCEVRESSFRPFDTVDNHEEMDALLREANAGMEELDAHWSSYYDRLGLPQDHFLRIELSNQRAYSVLYTNSPAWSGVQKPEDVRRLSKERQLWVAAALDAAAFLVSSVASRLDSSEFGNHNFHVGIIATARYLIRMCELLPDACNAQEVALSIDRLLVKLPYPFAGFAEGLRRTLARAREKGILPFSQMSSAAARRPVPSLQPALYQQPAPPPGLNPFPWHDPVQTVDLNQFMDAPASGTAAVSRPRADSIAWAEEFDLAAWFPATADTTEGIPLDFTALDVDMANFFPAAPQVWFDGSS
ncbi:hypothetical protein CC85DRAFT_42268 [Cutaneotrichosporon oleaginosum]|uniref:Transcription factor domain-containing protein n=1 Tax=Cutaneotrichosporon oleaginosum TaxID=879819 RepID=A0A0J0XRK9_9TREE|nr:uncharacterized protein CC85DRAFT_42268 [Cutaneotrichosporon oleaginosum]KLT43702.1 hypothetical protein CC85DRAFT_42268 [Cutaneotrichosporon oleaginosum]TXT05120.1 hypothetical protein COLE_06440 [Cutaneotrichosporon oleaginosum]